MILSFKFKCRVCGGHYALDSHEHPCPLCGGEWEESYWIEGETVKAIARLQGRSDREDELMLAIDEAWELDQELRRRLVALNPNNPSLGGWQAPRDRVVIEQVVLSYPHKNPLILEVGTYAGGCTNVFLIARPDAKYIGIDNWEAAPNLKQDFLNETEQFKDRIEIITGDSLEVGKTWNRKIDILMIDGCHDYPYALGDILNFTPWVKEGGIVMVDDYNCADVRKAVDRTLREDPDYELIRMPEPRIKGGEKLIVYRRV